MDSRKQVNDEEEAFLPQFGSHTDVAVKPRSGNQRHSGTTLQNWGLGSWLRILVEIIMAATILFQLVIKPFTAGGQTIRRTPVPEFPKKIYTFHDNPRYVRDDMWFNETLNLHTLRTWIELSSGSRGYVVVGDRSGYDLPEPYTVALDRHNDGPGYMMSVFHQLHCLSYLAEHYERGYAGVSLTEEVAHHSSHCFNYLRQGIMCSADTTLEGKTEAGPGEGSEHECTDYDALLEWANEHSAMKWRDGLVPDAAIL